eukprot:scaffold5504_cov101-Isochrysis_galbana.AAC.4
METERRRRRRPGRRRVQPSTHHVRRPARLLKRRPHILGRRTAQRQRLLARLAAGEELEPDAFSSSAAQKTARSGERVKASSPSGPHGSRSSISTTFQSSSLLGSSCQNRSAYSPRSPCSVETNTFAITSRSPAKTFAAPINEPLATSPHMMPSISQSFFQSRASAPAISRGRRQLATQDACAPGPSEVAVAENSESSNMPPAGMVASAAAIMRAASACCFSDSPWPSTVSVGSPSNSTGVTGADAATTAGATAAGGTSGATGAATKAAARAGAALGTGAARSDGGGAAAAGG